MKSKPAEVESPRAVLRRHGLRPDKRLGQNFLVDRGALATVVRAAELRPDETVLEIGAGLGGLTRQLAAAVRRVIAVEVDRRLIPLLGDQLEDLPNVEIVHSDALRLDLEATTHGAAYVVAANIPYQITSALIRRLMEAAHPPERLVLTLQAEVGERIVAAPGGMSLLALSVLMYGTPRLVGRIPAGAFWPVPDVESVVLRIDRRPSPRIAPDQIPTFFRLARAGFSQKRKMLRNAAAGGLAIEPSRVGKWLLGAGIPETARAQELGLDDWVRLFDQASADEWPALATNEGSEV